MYYKELETNALAKYQHNLNQQKNAADRLKRVSERKSKKKKERNDKH